ncbi:YhcN/YlaJ family sporulation lipoprotein [Oceanobacillus sp. Castelsardo]|uniref:YhcN/YlaJ family sporulation lipoprotein n=1 Tax=Oceanobacillus sp. Castelsardo TaxID=1851204 RepID=UPI00083869A9|nr:YhcN/YlaJ family sporulation lipoprotein [Oceanobacillus sp. Castelsardo]
MKKFFVSITAICLFLITSGCNTNNEAENSIQDMQNRNQIQDQLNPNHEFQTPSNQDINHQLGFVRYSKDEIDTQNMNNHEAKIDRREMADMITRLILNNDGFNEVATLVTDQEVLIAYDRDNNSDSKLTNEIAQKTAESVMPRFYKVYVSDNKSLMYDIQSLHNSNTNRDYDKLIQKLIKDMEKPYKHE